MKVKELDKNTHSNEMVVQVGFRLVTFEALRSVSIESLRMMVVVVSVIRWSERSRDGWTDWPSLSAVPLICCG